MLEPTGSFPPMSGGQHTLPRSTWLLLAGLTLGWGLNWPIMKIALADMPLWTFRSLSVAGGAAGIFAIAWAGRVRLLPRPAQWGRVAVSAFFNVTLWNLCIAYGLLVLPAGRSAILAYTMPLWVVVLSRLFLHEPLTVRRLAGVALGMAAMGLLIGSEWKALSAAPIGTALVIAAALSWAIGTVLIKRFPTDLPTTSFTAWQLLIGGAPIAVGALLLEDVGWKHLSWPATFAVWYNVLVAFVFCYWAWYKIVSRTSAGVSALGALMIPVVGVFSSMLMLGERPTWQEYVALALVVASIATVLVAPRRAARSAAGSRS